MTRRLAILAGSLFGATFALYVTSAGSAPFFTKAEAREALVVRSMLEGRGVVLPRRDGHIASKPPFFHWWAAFAARVGVLPTELAIRLPSLAAGAAGVATAGVVAEVWFGSPAGVLAAAILASSREWLHAATQCRVDMLLSVTLLFAVLAWQAVLARDDEARRPTRIGWIAAAMAVLTKGPVGIVLPLLIAIVQALVSGRVARLRRLLDPLAIAMFLLATVGWYAAATVLGGHSFLERQVLHENLQRFTGAGGRAGHAHPFYYYIPALAVAFLPWTLALPATARIVRSERRDRVHTLVAWIGTVFVFYSLAAGKRPAYLLPLFPPLAILVGAGLARGIERPAGGLLRAMVVLAGAVLLLVAGVIAIGDAQAILATFATRLGPGAPPAPALAGVLIDLRPWLISLLSLLALALLGSLVPRARTAAVLLAAAVVVVATGVVVTGPAARALSPRAFARAVETLVGAERVCSRGGVDFPLRYYLDRHLPTCPRVHGREELLPSFVLDVAGVNPPAGFRVAITDGGGLAAPERVLFARGAPGVAHGDGDVRNPATSSWSRPSSSPD